MKYIYNAVEPCRIGSVLVQKGDEWDFAEDPGPLWTAVKVPDPPKYKPITVAKTDKE